MATGDGGTIITDEGEAVEVETFAAEGNSIATVPVHISYGIIERFSEGLYSSPNKTFEELVTNSYDAGAERVWVYLPTDFEAPGATLVVIDDGESMDLDGLKNLWRIGESLKRTAQKPAGRARPVGKFGIGKLATYVLAERLTYIVHPGDEYLAVTMDYGRVAEGHELMAGTNLALEVVELTEEQAHQAIRDAMASAQHEGDESLAEQALAALGDGHWTAAILTHLKDTAKRISIGRLRWVMSTALPLNPGFSLWLNDSRVASSKAGAEPSWTFTVGQDEGTLSTKDDRPWGPGVAGKVKIEVEQPGDKGKPPTLTEKEVPALTLPNAGLVYGPRSCTTSRWSEARASTSVAAMGSSSEFAGA